MKVNPYLHFRGNCAQAITFYEDVFGIKAENVVKFSDMPQEAGYKITSGTEDYITHACLNFGEENALHGIMMSDWTQAEIGTNMSISVAFNNLEEAQVAFDKLKVGGKVEQPLAKTFWSEGWGSIVDKFGIQWQITVK